MRLDDMVIVPQAGKQLSDQTASEDSLLLVEALSKRAIYPEYTAQVELCETHISWVFLTDQRAYKLKKPVKFDFLDFSTVERRREACENEFRLNRRLSPQVYLGVVPITRTPQGGLEIDGGGAVVDWLVKMRRLPSDRCLEHVVQTGDLADADVDGIARTLATFYSQLPPIDIRTETYRRRIEEHVIGNHEELSNSRYPFDAEQVRRIHANQLRYLRLYDDVFDNRARDGRIVDGHGDLRPDHIYLQSTPTIIDCIEFNAEFRQLDVLDDLSFLAVECAVLGAEDVGGRVLECYCQSSGDRPPAALLSFYMSYRASVRGKVIAIRALQLHEEQRSAALSTAQRYLQLADRYAGEIGPPLLVVVRGLTGTGKSTIATALSETLCLELLQTDAIRRDMFGASAGQTEYDAGHYRLEKRTKVYDTMLERAGDLLANRHSVVLDGTFLRTHNRSRAALLARHHGALPVIIECNCPAESAIQRIAERGQDTLSESRPEFVELQRSQNEEDPAGLTSFPCDTTECLPEILRNVCGHLRGQLAR